MSSSLTKCIRQFMTFFIFFLPVLSFGQGVIQGIVTDSTTGDPLVGANVYLQGTALGGVTDLDGKYRVVSVRPGEYTVRYSYLGYHNSLTKISLSDNETKIINAKLLPDVIQGNEVVITAQARGQLSAINQQLKSSTIVNVVSEEKIKELPDANAAEAIGRLPGVSILRSGGEANKVILRGLSDKFAKITIDGVGIATTDENARGVDLSMISQSALTGIELYKVLTPDKDADAIAGSINLVTKKAPSIREIRIDAKGNYNKLKPTLKQYDFAFQYGERFFSDIIGVQVAGNLEQKDRSSERINLNTTIPVNGAGLDQQYQYKDFIVEFYDEERKRDGVNLYLDVNTPDSGTIRFNNVYSGTGRNILHHLRDYPNGTSDLISNANGVSYIYNYTEQKIQSYSSLLRGENYLFDISATWGLSYSQSISDKPYENELQFTEPQANDGTSGMREVPPSLYQGPPEAYADYAVNNFQKAYLAYGYFRTGRNFEKERTAYLDLSKKYVLGDMISGEAKAGGKYKIKNRIKTSTEEFSPYYLYGFDYIKSADGTISPKNYQGTRFNNLSRNGHLILMVNFLDPNPVGRNVFDKYKMYPLINSDAIQEWYTLNQDGYNDVGKYNEYQLMPLPYGDYYNVTERVSAWYAMNRFTFGDDVTLIAGVRVEKENNDYNARYNVGTLSGGVYPTGVFKDTLTTYTETNTFPHLHLTVKPTEFLSFRFAVYKALARPDFNFRLAKFIGDGTNNLTMGNTNLKSAKAWNYEINTQIYSNTIGLISVSAFYKNISDMFYTTDAIVGDNAKLTSGVTLLDSLNVKPPFVAPSLYKLTVPYNITQPTKVWGFEFEHQANLNFLPGYLQFIVLSYNVSLIKSETYNLTRNYYTVTDTIHDPIFGDYTVPRSVNYYYQKKNKLENQPELFGNFAVGYDIAGFSGRMSFFYQSEFAQSYSENGRSQSIIDEFLRWDLSVKQVVTENVSLLFNINNLNDYYEGTSSRHIVNPTWTILDTRVKYGLTADLGVRVML